MTKEEEHKVEEVTLALSGISLAEARETFQWAIREEFEEFFLAFFPPVTASELPQISRTNSNTFWVRQGLKKLSKRNTRNSALTLKTQKNGASFAMVRRKR